MADYNSYQKSISKELNSIKNRVREFIGSSHWGEDGRYKEIILRDIISEKLPSIASCGTGFVVGNGEKISTQIDIIVFRNDIPLLFSKGDFVIASQESVLGIIEVKTKLNSANLESSIKKSHENGEIIEHPVFNGIFSYGHYYASKDTELYINNILKTTLNNYSGKLNYIAFGKDYFLKYWDEGQPFGESGKKYRLYKIKDLSFGYFISNLIEDSYNAITRQPIPESLKAVLYPIENTKEAHKVDTLFL